MKFRKTIFLFFLLIALALVAYVMERPKKSSPTVGLFPEFSTEAAALIDIHNKEENVILAKTDKGWQIQDELGFPVDPELAKKTLESIAELEKDKNVVSKNPENQKLFEVDPNQGIKVQVSDQNKKVIADFLVGKTGPDFMSTYIRKAGTDEVLLCEGYHLRSAFSRTKKNWYDLNICKFTTDEISRIEIISEGKKLALKKDQDSWQITDPNQAPAKKNIADDLANSLSRLRATDLLKADNLAEYELDSTKKQVIVSLADGSQKTINIGKMNENNQYYLKAEKDVVFLVSKYNAEKFNKTFEELKEIPPKEEPKEEPQGEPAKVEPESDASQDAVIPPPAAPSPAVPSTAVLPPAAPPEAIPPLVVEDANSPAKSGPSESPSSSPPPKAAD